MRNLTPVLLSFDTSTSCCSLAITRGTAASGEVVASLSLNSTVTHSRKILQCIDYLFSQSGLDWSSVNGIAVGLGPGSFTGLRIGMATAKGLALATNLPLLGVSSLMALAAGCQGERRVYAVLDARKRQVYCAQYDCRHGVLPQVQGDIRVCEPQDITPEIEEDSLLVGDGIASYGPIFLGDGKKRLRFAAEHLHTVSASAIGLLCGMKYVQHEMLDPALATPLYVRASDAELNLAEKKKKEMESAV